MALMVQRCHCVSRLTLISPTAAFKPEWTAEWWLGGYNRHSEGRSSQSCVNWSEVPAADLLVLASDDELRLPRGKSAAAAPALIKALSAIASSQLHISRRFNGRRWDEATAAVQIPICESTFVLTCTHEGWLERRSLLEGVLNAFHTAAKAQE